MPGQLVKGGQGADPRQRPTARASSDEQVSCRAVVGSDVEVSAGGGDGGTAEGGLDEVDGGAVIEGVRGVGVAQPMG